MNRKTKEIWEVGVGAAETGRTKLGQQARQKARMDRTVLMLMKKFDRTKGPSTKEAVKGVFNPSRVVGSEALQ